MAIVDIVERDIPLRHKLDTVPCMIVMLRVEEYDYDNEYKVVGCGKYFMTFIRRFVEKYGRQTQKHEDIIYKETWYDVENEKWRELVLILQTVKPKEWKKYKMLCEALENNNDNDYYEIIRQITADVIAEVI